MEGNFPYGKRIFSGAGKRFESAVISLSVRGDLRDITHNEFMYSAARGFFFDGSEAYVVEVYDGGKTEELGVKVYKEDDEFIATVLNQPSLHGSGMNESLSILDGEARLPETDKELEAFARYALQQTEDDLEYNGPRKLDELEY